MSDLVVVEETGSTVVIQEVSAANIVEVVAAGPQGPQGIQGLKGDKGDTGDVTPEALAAKVAAETAATNAATSATSASTSATAAASSATSAASSATTATTKASEASTSATNAAASATSAATSAATATTKASEATTSATNAAASATTASTKAAEAATSASNAATSASSASTSASTATTKASDAAASASAAATSATSSANSATSATNSANSAATSASSASSSATSAAGSAATATTKASEAAASATTASTKANEASTSATNAASSATSASTSASTATTKASEAATSATNASNSATASANSASAASSSATAAAGSASTAQTAATTATTKAGEASSSATSAAASAAAAANSANIATTGGIRFDTVQSLSSGEKTQAQSNIGIDSLGVDLGFAGTGRRIKGDFGNSVHSLRVLVQDSTPNASTLFGLIPSGTGNIARFYAYNSSDADNAGFAQLAALSTEARITSGQTGTGAYLPLTVWLNGSEKARWALSTGNLLLGQTTDNGTDKLQVNGSISATQFSGSAAGLTGLKTVNGNSILGAGDIAIVSGVSSFNTRTGAITLSSLDVSGALGFTPEDAANRNAANGYAGLDSAGKVAAAQLPSYVDDVLEYANLAAFPGTGEASKIYVTLDTNKTYRWSGSAYVEISASPGSTDSLTEGSTNLYFTTARARSSVSASGSLSYNSTTGVFGYTAPTALSEFANDSGFITSSALSPYLTSATAASTYQTQSGMSSYLTSASAASTYQTQSAMSAYLTTAAAASTYLPLAGGSLSGSLDFSGANRRITGDFTSTSRVLVQTTSANSNTVFGLIPNGTAVNSQFHVWGASDITNAPLGAFTINSAAVQIQSSAAGTGTPLPFRILIGSTEALRIDATTQNLLVGTSTDSGNGDKLQVNGSARFSGQIGGGPFRVYGASGIVFNSLQSGSTGSYANFQNGTGAMQVGRDDGSGSQWGTANANAVWATGAYPLIFGVNSGEGARFNPTTRALLIGTTTDNGTDKLQVNGSLSATTLKGTLSGNTLVAYQEQVQVVGTVSTTTYNIDLSLANIFDITLGANVTFTFTNPPASNYLKPVTIILRQDATGSRTATFTNANYTDGAAPVLSTGANQIDVLTYFTINGGSFWFGTFAMANVS